MLTTVKFKVGLGQERRNNPNHELVGRVSAVTPFISCIASGTFPAGKSAGLKLPPSEKVWIT